jgi:hypothetical protein
MWAPTFLLGSCPKLARKEPRTVSHFGHPDARHVFDGLSPWWPCSEAARPHPCHAPLPSLASLRSTRAPSLALPLPLPRVRADAARRGRAPSSSCCCCTTVAAALLLPLLLRRCRHGCCSTAVRRPCRCRACTVQSACSHGRRACGRWAVPLLASAGRARGRVWTRLAMA